MSKPAELDLFDFLQERVDASSPDDVIYQLEIHDTVYQSITKNKGVRISDAVATVAPGPGGGMREVNALVILACFVKVEGKNQKQRSEATQAVFDLQQAVYQLLYDDPTLGGRVCDSMPQRGSRSYDTFKATPYAIANIPVVINPDGTLKGYQG